MKTKKMIQNRIPAFVLRLAFFVCAIVVWLSPFRFSWNYVILLAGFFAVLFLIDCIRQPVAAFAVFIAATVGLDFFDVRFTVCFSPFLCVWFMVRNLARDTKSKSIKYDGVFFAGMLLLGGYVAAGFFSGFSHFWHHWDIPAQFHREYVALIAAGAVFLYYFLRRSSSVDGKKKRTGLSEKSKKLRFVYVAAILCLPAVGLYLSSRDDYTNLSALPAFLVAVLPALADAERLGPII